MGIFNEVIIFSVSFKGRIIDPKGKRRRRLLFWLLVRIILMMVEVVTCLSCMVAVYGPAPYAADALQCREYHDGPLVFARAVVAVMFVVDMLYIVGFLIFVDPCGICCSPSILPSIGDQVDGLLRKSPAEMEVNHDHDHEYVDFTTTTSGMVRWWTRYEGHFVAGAPMEIDRVRRR